MRPTRVQMEGFSTFREPTEVVFDSVDLVAFVGPTGSGKSTIIDAITFALYGSVARFDDARLVAPVINQGSNEAKVRLDFEVAGQNYTAVRIVRRTQSKSKGPGATTKEARLQRDDVAVEGQLGGSTVIASGAKELTAAIEDLLGLDFAQFTRTVVLPQGQFAEFLKDDPASRQRLLRRLLDLEIYSRMGSLARERARGAGQQLELLRIQIEKFEDTTAEHLVAANTRVRALALFQSDASGKLDQLAEVEGRLGSLRTEVLAIDDNVKRLRLIELPNELTAEGQEITAAAQALTQARDGVTQARTKRDEAQKTLAEIGDPQKLSSQLMAHARLSELSPQLEILGEQRDRANKRSEESGAEAADADEQLERARSALSVARRGAEASCWTESLVVGEACPVCRQEVAVIPDHDPSAELTSATAIELAAVKQVKKAQQEQREAQADVDRFQGQLEHVASEVARVRASLIEVASPEVLSAQLDKASAAKKTVQASMSVVTDAEQSVTRAETEVERLEKREQTHRHQFGSQRDGVAALDPPAPKNESLVDDWDALLSWSQVQQADLAERRVGIAEDGKTAAAGKDELVRALQQGSANVDLSFGLGEGEDVTALGKTIARAQATAEASVARITERIAQQTDLKIQIEGLEETQTVNSALGQQLSASGFERWLLAEALDDLVSRATVRLLELSGGQYSLATDDTAFKIIDHHNADDLRDVRTLSGGETFLASLALALALSDSIAEMAPVDAPRLGSVFLDEGFGTLDPETLDVVASAIEDLSARGRLVGIVTHIDGLAERMPVRFVVSKGPVTSTIEKVSL